MLYSWKKHWYKAVPHDLGSMKSSVQAISRAGSRGRQRYLVDTWVSDLAFISTYTIGGTYTDVKKLIRLADFI